MQNNLKLLILRGMPVDIVLQRVTMSRLRHVRPTFYV